MLSVPSEAGEGAGQTVGAVLFCLGQGKGGQATVCNDTKRTLVPGKKWGSIVKGQSPDDIHNKPGLVTCPKVI